MMRVTIPVEVGNRTIKDGVLPKTMQAFVDRMKPEASYFLANEGKRSALFVFDLKEPSMIPSVAESFFSNLQASIELAPVMNLEDMKIGVERAMKQPV
jgi:hypothetical protein